MFELKISGIFEAGRWADNGWPTHIISMVDPGVAIQFSADNHLKLHLHDAESQLRSDWILPNESHVESILDFTKDLKDSDRLLVHCHQGLSRSTAAAIGVMLQHGMDYQQAYEHVESVRDILLPNGLIIQILDNKFELDGKLHKLIMDNRREKMKKRMDRNVNETNHNDVLEMKSILEKLKHL